MVVDAACTGARVRLTTAAKAGGGPRHAAAAATRWHGTTQAPQHWPHVVAQLKRNGILLPTRATRTDDTRQQRDGEQVVRVREEAPARRREGHRVSRQPGRGACGAPAAQCSAAAGGPRRTSPPRAPPASGNKVARGVSTAMCAGLSHMCAAVVRGVFPWGEWPCLEVKRADLGIVQALEHVVGRHGRAGALLLRRAARQQRARPAPRLPPQRSARAAHAPRRALRSAPPSRLQRRGMRRRAALTPASAVLGGKNLTSCQGPCGHLLRQIFLQICASAGMATSARSAAHAADRRPGG